MKQIIAKLFAYGLPLWYFFLFFFLYGYGKTDPITLNKIAGLLALLLIGTSFFIGSLSYFLPRIFVPMRSYRKYIGICGFIVALIHVILSLVFYYNFDLYFAFLDPNNQHLSATYAGLFALFYFFFMTVTSTTKAIQLLGSKRWKILQTAGYFALVLAMLHFYLAETNNGVFVIRRLLGQITFVFGFLVLLTRLIVWLLVIFHKRVEQHSASTSAL